MLPSSIDHDPDVSRGGGVCSWLHNRPKTATFAANENESRTRQRHRSEEIANHRAETRHLQPLSERSRIMRARPGGPEVPSQDRPDGVGGRSNGCRRSRGHLAHRPLRARGWNTVAQGSQAGCSRSSQRPRASDAFLRLLARPDRSGGRSRRASPRPAAGRGLDPRKPRQQEMSPRCPVERW